MMTVAFSGEVWYWRGPAPFFFVTVPAPVSQEIKEVAALVTYGWGMVPVKVTLGSTAWTTAMFPKEGCYIVPLKDKVRTAENVNEGDQVNIALEIAID